MLKNKSGFSLVETTIVLGITVAAAAGLMGLLDSQSKAGNRLEFVNTKEQLRSTMIAQFLNTPENCKCVFQDASFNISGVTPSMTFTDGNIGRRKFTTPGDCSSSTVPMKLINTTDFINTLKATSIVMKNVQEVSGVYLGVFSLKLKTNKSVTGSKEAQIEIPVVLSTIPDPGDPTKYKVGGCAINNTGAGGGTSCRIVYEIFEHDNCRGERSYRHSDWTNEGTPGGIKWTFRDSLPLYGDPNGVGAPVTDRNGRNFITSDVSCTRIGIQCR